MPKRTLLRISIACLAMCFCVLNPACGRKAGSSQVAIAVSPEIAELTKQLRRYSFEKRQLPKRIEELVTAGYVKSIPAAPAGKKYAIDNKKAVVVLVDQ